MPGGLLSRPLIAAVRCQPHRTGKRDAARYVETERHGQQ